jgi:hypothetical protein
LICNSLYLKYKKICIDTYALKGEETQSLT